MAGNRCTHAGRVVPAAKCLRCHPSKLTGAIVADVARGIEVPHAVQASNAPQAGAPAVRGCAARAQGAAHLHQTGPEQVRRKQHQPAVHAQEGLWGDVLEAADRRIKQERRVGQRHDEVRQLHGWPCCLPHASAAVDRRHQAAHLAYAIPYMLHHPCLRLLARLPRHGCHRSTWAYTASEGYQSNICAMFDFWVAVWDRVTRQGASQERVKRMERTLRRRM